MAAGQNKQGEPDLSDIVGIWPSAVWILTGLHFYLNWPDLFVGWKGVLYFVLGTTIVSLIMGLAGRNLRRAMLDMMSDTLREDRRLSAVLPRLISGLVAVGEALLVSLLARSLLQALG